MPDEISFGITRFTALLSNANPIRLKIISLYGFSTLNILGFFGFPPGVCCLDLFVILIKAVSKFEDAKLIAPKEYSFKIIVSLKNKFINDEKVS